ncbi:pentapeptide repeat-containing protein [Leptospira yasudae]|uniref:pentapeptide repeat-containing protein n=1 Tax=Leptospira yasudae TaxID=2202201 RepID=UPI00298F6122|nr:pentapeptide repeat-containing protein [Leptospira yasudae]
MSIIYIPQAYYDFYIYDEYLEVLTISEEENVKNELRKIILAILGGSLAVGGFILTYYRTKNQDETLLLTQKGQWNDRYVKAIELIDKEASDIRIGGIYSLISIAAESKQHKATIIKILCAYIREKLNIKKRDLPNIQDKVEMDKISFERERFPIDHEAILNFLSQLRRIDREEGQNSLILLRFIDFSFYHIGPLNLSYSELSEIDFTYSKIHNLNLSKSKIHNITIRFTQSTAIDFNSSFVIRCHFDRTNLIFCEFIESQLVVVDFGGSLLNQCDFQNSNLKSVNFNETALIGCNFIGAKIDDHNIFLKTRSLWNCKFDTDVMKFLLEKKKELFDPMPEFDPFYIIK